jgi:hypothetical protein
MYETRRHRLFDKDSELYEVPDTFMRQLAVCVINFASSLFVVFLLMALMYYSFSSERKTENIFSTICKNKC